ncbi:MAG: transporter [Patescibacteria group bacterium]|nr:transporter [Patescibacteria group bacterium]
MSQVKPHYTKQTLSLFWQHIKRYPQHLWPLLFTIPATVLVGEFLRPYVTADILNRLSTGSYDHHNLLASFGSQLLIFAAASIFYGVIGWRVTNWISWRLELKVMRELTQRVFGHLLAMSPNFHANRFGGSLVSQTNKLNGAYIRLMDSTVFAVIPLVISVIATVVILVPRAPLYVAALLVISAVYLVGTIHFSRAVRDANAEEAAVQSRQTGYLSDSITNVFAIKTFAAADYEGKRFWKMSGLVQEAGHKSMRATLKRENYASLLTQTLGIVALCIAVIGVGVLKADIGTIFLVVSYTASMAERLWNFQNVLRQYNRAMGDASDMVEILQIKPGIQDPARPEPSRMRQGAITFTGVTFTHGDADETLFEDFSLKIKPGEKIGLVGHSGSGKTTLTRLLLRFSDLDSGHITIDGQDIAAVTQDDLRRAISYVPQEPMLFHRTLRENIAYGKLDAPEEEIMRAATRAHAHEFIGKIPKGYETMVGERGIKLSGGQRQRIAIARAMLKDAPILVLDEATSALDSESEHLIQDALWSLMEGRTAIVIAHRLSTIQHMDRIIVLEDGRITEQGSHAKLLAKGGAYAKLWSRQSGGFIDGDEEAAAEDSKS